MNGTPPLSENPLDGDFDREHLRLVTNKLSEKARALHVANSRLEALAELNVQLASERDTDGLPARHARDGGSRW